MQVPWPFQGDDWGGDADKRQRPGDSRSVCGGRVGGVAALICLATIAFSWKVRTTIPGANSAGDTGPPDRLNNPNAIRRDPPPGSLRTLDEIEASFEEFLPCNYVHDGYFLKDSNMVLEQVYQGLQELIAATASSDKASTIPIVVEVGGHDGISKSMTLKAGRCLRVNTLLVEANPTTYTTLRRTRRYDTTVNAALCDQDAADAGTFVEIVDNPVNSGEARTEAVHGDANDGAVAPASKVPCTTLDDEIDAMLATVTAGTANSRAVILFLVLDIEGNEPTAVGGIRRHIPRKAQIETKQLDKAGKAKVDRWWTKAPRGWDGGTGSPCGVGDPDTCYGFSQGDLKYPRKVFYGARKFPPKGKVRTSEASLAYMYYGT